MPETLVMRSQFDEYFYAIRNFYFLLNISVTHRPRITNTFVLVHPLHLYFLHLEYEKKRPLGDER